MSSIVFTAQNNGSYSSRRALLNEKTEYKTGQHAMKHRKEYESLWHQRGAESRGWVEMFGQWVWAAK